VRTVFQEHSLPEGKLELNGRTVRPDAIRDIALMTVEGEKDDITGRGQTEAAHVLTPNLPEPKHMHYTQEKVGHYGVFNGSRFRRFIQPKIRGFIRAQRTMVSENFRSRARAAGNDRVVDLHAAKDGLA